MKHTLFGLIAAATVFLFSNCFADTKNIDEPNNWKTECIGRYQVNVPGDVEIIFSIPRALSNSSMDIEMAKYLDKSSMKALRSPPLSSTLFAL